VAVADRTGREEELHTVLDPVEEHRIGLDLEEGHHIGLVAVVRHIDLVLVGELRTDPVEGHHIGLVEHRTGLGEHHIRQVLGCWSSHPWNRSYGQWHQEVT
jgi:hypothetical protein